MYTKPKILVTESREFSAKAAALLRAYGDLELADLGMEELSAAVPGVDVLWIRLRHYIGGDLMSRAPQLRLIASPTTGLNHIDTAAAADRGIGIVSLRGETEFLRDVRATAEHTLALMLALLRRVPAATNSVLRGVWDRDRFKGSELYGKTIGIVGYGRVGRIVARYLRAFDARVIAADVRPVPEAAQDGVETMPLDELLNRADMVSLHVDLNQSTGGFFGWDEFRRMKPGAYFVNTSRGELVLEEALLWALEYRRLSGAALDVIRGEHDGSALGGPLVRYARENTQLLITPHIGGCTGESMEKTEVFLAQKVIAALERTEQVTAASSAWTAHG